MPLLVFALCLNLAGCSMIARNTNESESTIRIIKEEDTPDDEDENIDTDVKEDSKEIDTSETTSNLGYKSGDYAPTDISIEPVEICNSKNVVVRAEELVGDPEDQYIGLILYVGNDTNKTLTLKIRDLYANNYLIAEDLNEVITVNAGKEDNQLIAFYKYQLERLNIVELCQISLSVSVLTENNYELVASDIVDIPTSSYDRMKEPALRDGDVLVGDNDDMFAAFYSEGPGLLGVYVYNKTEKEMMISGTDVTIGGNNFGDIIHMRVPPGKAIAYYFNLETSYTVGQYFDNSEITSVTAKIAYRTTNSIEPIWESDPITVDLS